METEHISKRIKRHCEVCGAGAGHYKCPRCEVVSCSSQCYQQHVRQQKCEPKKQRFCREEGSDQMISEDVRFLCSIGTAVESHARRSVDLDMKTATAVKKPLPPGVLRSAAEAVGVTVKTQPQGMSLRAQNTTSIVKKTGKLRWRIIWKFEKVGVSKIDAEVSDEASLGDLVRRFTVNKAGLIPVGWPKSVKAKDIASYVEAGADGLWVILEELAQPQERTKKYLKLRMDRKLRWNLCGVTVVEFPVFYVLLPSEVDTDDANETIAGRWRGHPIRVKDGDPPQQVESASTET